MCLPLRYHVHQHSGVLLEELEDVLPFLLLFLGRTLHLLHAHHLVVSAIDVDGARHLAVVEQGAMGSFLQQFVDESAGPDLSLFYCLLCAVSHVILSLQPLHSLGQPSIIAPLQQLIDRSSVSRHLMNSLILLIPLTHGAVHPPVTY